MNDRCDTNLVMPRMHPTETNKKKQSLKNGVAETCGSLTTTAMIPDTTIGTNIAVPSKAPRPSFAASSPSIIADAEADISGAPLPNATMVTPAN